MILHQREAYRGCSRGRLLRTRDIAQESLVEWHNPANNIPSAPLHNTAVVDVSAAVAS